MAGTRTRKSSGTKLRDFLGGARPLLLTECPTMRDVLRQALHLQEQELLVKETDRRNYPVKEVMSDILPMIKSQWQAANAMFKHPVIVSDQVILNKIVTGWKQASDYCYKRMKKNKQEKFLKQLDKVVDILKCKCNISSCSEANCAGCNTEAHINCSCPKQNKIPKLELNFVLAQRTKVGDFSAFQIAGNNVKETKRQKKQLDQKNKEEMKVKRMKNDKETTKEDIETDTEDNILGDTEKEKVNDDPDFSLPMSPPKSKYNMTKIPNIALASIRYGVEDRPTAAIVTATLQDYALITKEDCSQVVDPSKIRRWKQKVMKEKQCSDEEKNKEDIVNCIFFDGRRDSTNMMKFNEET